MSKISHYALLAAALFLSACGKPDTSTNGNPAPAKIKIGYLIKQPDEPWFQTEWKFAQKAADETGFDLVKIGATDGEKVLSAIDNLAAQGAQGFVICTPDVRLGPAIVAKAGQYNMKIVTVDDQFLGADGVRDERCASSRNVPWRHRASSWRDRRSRRCEKGAGNRRKQPPVSPALRSSTPRKRRTDGAKEALIAGGFPSDKSTTLPTRARIFPAVSMPRISASPSIPEVKHWLIVGMNDSAVLGAVRATEGRGIAPADVIGVGINGTDCQSEFQKPAQTGFFGSLLLSPNKHGHDTTMSLYHWIKDGIEPPKATFIKRPR